MYTIGTVAMSTVNFLWPNFCSKPVQCYITGKIGGGGANLVICQLVPHCQIKSSPIFHLLCTWLLSTVTAQADTRQLKKSKMVMRYQSGFEKQWNCETFRFLRSLPPRRQKLAPLKKKTAHNRAVELLVPKTPVAHNAFSSLTGTILMCFTSAPTP